MLSDGLGGCFILCVVFANIITIREIDHRRVGKIRNRILALEICIA